MLSILVPGFINRANVTTSPQSPTRVAGACGLIPNSSVMPQPFATAYNAMTALLVIPPLPFVAEARSGLNAMAV